MPPRSRWSRGFLMFTPCESQTFSLTLPPQAIKRNDEFHVSSLPAETVRRDFLVLSPQNRRKRRQTINPPSFTFTPLYGLARALPSLSAISRGVNIPKVQFYYRNSRKFNYPHPRSEKKWSGASNISYPDNDYLGSYRGKIDWFGYSQDQNKIDSDTDLAFDYYWGRAIWSSFFLGPPRMGSPSRVRSSTYISLLATTMSQRAKTPAE